MKWDLVIAAVMLFTAAVLISSTTWAVDKTPCDACHLEQVIVESGQ